MLEYIINYFDSSMTPWRNGSASDSRSEGCVFKSRRGQIIFIFLLFNFDEHFETLETKPGNMKKGSFKKTIKQIIICPFNLNFMFATT